MAAFTRALVRWQNAYSEFGGSGPEVFINVPAVKTPKGAQRVADAVLSGVVDIDMIQSFTGILDVGNASVIPGEVYAGSQVTGAHYEMAGDDGELTIVTPTLVGEATIRSEAAMRRAERLGIGSTLWGTPEFTPRQTGARVDNTPPEVSFDGEVYPRYSPLWRAPKAWQGSWVEVTVAEAGWLDTGFRVGKVFQGGELDGSIATLADVVVKAGKKRAIVMMNEPWQAGELLVVWCYRHGGSKQATVSLKGTMI